jgi:low temperature requirement protein LtrA
MTVAIPQAYAHRGLLFAGCYLALRLVLWAEMRHRPLYGGLRLEPFTASLLAGAPLFVLGGALHGPSRVAAWTAAALTDVLGPALLGHRLDRVRVESQHRRSPASRGRWPRR